MGHYASEMLPERMPEIYTCSKCGREDAIKDYHTKNDCIRHLNKRLNHVENDCRKLWDMIHLHHKALLGEKK